MSHDIYWTGKPARSLSIAALKQTIGENKPLTSRTSFEALLNASLNQVKDPQKNKIDLPMSYPPLMEKPLLPAAGKDADEGFKESLAFVLKQEGNTYVSKDGRRGPSKLGILQSTAREYGYRGDIKNLTREDATAIYKQIWVKSGSSKLPYPLNTIHFDTYVNSPAAARKILVAADGNVAQYLEMRSQRYQRLAEYKPEVYEKYLTGWMKRISQLKMIASSPVSPPREGKA